jgi:hypothetical protein
MCSKEHQYHRGLWGLLIGWFYLHWYLPIVDADVNHPEMAKWNRTYLRDHSAVA